MRLERKAAALLLMSLTACNRPSDEKPAASLSQPAGLQAGQSSAGRRGRITADGMILADTFVVRHEMQGEQLTLSLETDLPDQTALMVSVDRTYRTREDSEEYPIEYFSESSTVGAWRSPRTLTIDNEGWKRQLDERRRTLAVAGEPFTVRSIRDTIEISFVVPVNQDPPFQSRNENLHGRVVETNEYGLRLIRREIPVGYLIDASDLDASRWADPLALSAGKTYALPGVTPLVPEIEPADPMSAIARIQQMPAGTQVRVLEVHQRQGLPWYRVRVTAGEPVGAEGWINSTALIGKTLKEIGG
jgi:hypothetical protein